MFKQNRNLVIIALIAIVNALGYGIIIPILYTYSKRYGLSDFQNGLLFALFSIGQFLATPIIGRMSDKYGRKPLLVLSITGTVISFFTMAFAPSWIFLFLARLLDGLTAGNIPVASAVISDTTEPKDRAKGFGIIGASFGFGFIFGPAISAVTVGFGESVPFIIAGVVSAIAALSTLFFLPETNKHIGEVKKGKLFDFSKLFHALFDENVGLTLVISLLYWFSFSVFIYAYQPYAVKILHMTANQNSLMFTMFGVLGLISQVVLLHRLTKKFGLKGTFMGALFTVVIAFLVMYLNNGFWVFVAAQVFLGLANSMVNPLIQTVLSREADEKSQGSIQGLNASYMSIGQIFGPIFGGALATISIPLPFLAGSIVAFACFLLSFNIMKPGYKRESAF